MEVRVGNARSARVEVGSGTPQGGCLSGVLFLAAADQLLRLPFSRGTHCQAYADDILLVRYTGDEENRLCLQRDVQLLTTTVNSLGMQFNPAKSVTLTVGFSPAHQTLSVPIHLSGQALEQVSQLKYLGITVDARFSNETYWIRAAASAKRTLGALHRLLRRHKDGFRHACRTYAFSLYNHAIVPSPPSTREGWRKLNNVFTFASRLLTNQWTLPSDSVQALAQLPSAAQHYYQLALKFLFRCLCPPIEGLRQRYGRWLAADGVESEGLRRSQRISEQHPRAAPAFTTPTTKEAWRRTGAFLLHRLWNGTGFARAFPADPGAPLANDRRFFRLIPTLIQTLPTEPLDLLPSSSS